MKKLKCLIALTALGTTFVPLASCGSKQQSTDIIIKFDCSDGIVLEGQKNILIPANSKWSYVIDQGLVPKVTVPVNYTSFGWCVQNEVGEWRQLKESDVLAKDITISYLGYSNEVHPAITVNLSFDESADPYKLPFAVGFTFEDFKWYYDIPSQPTEEGYTFDGYYKVNGSSLTPIKDTDVFDANTTQIRGVFKVNKHTATLTTDGHGTVTPASLTFDYGTEWGTLKSKLVVKPDDVTVHEFDKWVDEAGNEIPNETQLTSDFTAKACFKDIVYRTIQLTHSEGVKDFTPTQLRVVNGTKWGDIQGKPTPEPEIGYGAFGWVSIDAAGEFEVVDDNTVIDCDKTFRYVAYNEGAFWTVNFKLEPDSSTPYEPLPAVKNSDFATFKATYGLPETPVYEGYTFKGYYANDSVGGWTLINDNYKFTENVAIEARYDVQIEDLTFNTNGHGTVNPSVKSVNYGTKFGDAIQDLQIIPDNGYVLSGWVDKDGISIGTEYIIKQNMTITAIFSPYESKIAMLTDSYMSYGSKGDSRGKNDIKYDQLQSGIIRGAQGWKDPSFVGDTLKIDGDKNSSDGRLIAINFKVNLSVPPHTLRKTKLHLKGWSKVWAGAHMTRSMLNSVVQFLQLSDATDRPDFYAWPNNEDDDKKRNFDSRCTYHYTYYVEHHSLFKSFTKTHNYDCDVMEFEHENTTSEPMTFTHYFQVAFAHSGWDPADSSDQRAWLEFHLNLVDA